MKISKGLAHFFEHIMVFLTFLGGKNMIFNEKNETFHSNWEKKKGAKVARNKLAISTLPWRIFHLGVFKITLTLAVNG